MAADERQLSADRATRNAARAVFVTRLGRVRSELAERGIGARVADKIKDDAQDLLNTGIEVASERKGVIAGTIGALLLWIFRRPIIEAAKSLFSDDDSDEAPDEESDEPDHDR